MHVFNIREKTPFQKGKVNIGNICSPWNWSNFFFGGFDGPSDSITFPQKTRLEWLPSTWKGPSRRGTYLQTLLSLWLPLRGFSDKYSILFNTSCGFLSFGGISFSWIRSIWCSGVSIIRIGWKYPHRSSWSKSAIFLSRSTVVKNTLCIFQVWLSDNFSHGVFLVHHFCYSGIDIVVISRKEEVISNTKQPLGLDSKI